MSPVTVPEVLLVFFKWYKMKNLKPHVLQLVLFGWDAS